MGAFAMISTVNLKWNENIKECRICNNRRKGRKLLGGPIPLNLAPKQAGGPVCCALKPEECCMQNPYAPSGLPYDAAFELVLTFNVLFWIYVVLMGLYLWVNLPSFMNNENTAGPYLAENPGVHFFWVSWFTILFWTFLLWFPLYIVASFGYMLYYKREMANRECCGFFDLFFECRGLIVSYSQQWCTTTPLIFAARHGRTEQVKSLLAAPNIDVNAKDRTATTALCHAADRGHTEIVKALLAAPNIDVNAKDDAATTPLSHAARCGHTEIVKALLATPNIDVNAKDDAATTPLSHAAGRGHTEIVEALLAHIEMGAW